MDENIVDAYERLRPKDQLIIDSTILALYQKDMELREVCKDAMEQFKRANDIKLRLRSCEVSD